MRNVIYDAEMSRVGCREPFLLVRRDRRQLRVDAFRSARRSPAVPIPTHGAQSLQRSPRTIVRYTCPVVRQAAASDRQVVSNDQFRDAMLPFTTALERWAVAWAGQQEGAGYLPAADSRGMAELAEQRTWSVSAWLEPIRNAFSYADTLAYKLAEHLAAYAKIVHSQVGPAYSHMPTVRAVLEAAPIAHWLLDPSVGAEVRIKRSIAYRLDSADQAGRMQHLPGAAADSQKVRRACSDYLHSQGWVLKDKAVDGERLPTAAQFSQVAFGKVDVRLDMTSWGLMSAAQHGTWYALQLALDGDEMITTPLDPLGGLARIMVRSDTLTTFGLMCFEGCDAVARARDELYGWQRPAEMIDAAAQVRDFGARMRAESEARP